MADNQAASPTTDDKINALTDLVTKLAKQVSGMVSRDTMRRADDAKDDGDDTKKDWDEDEDEKAKKDAARDTLFGKRDAAKADEDEDEKEKEEEEEEKKDAAADAAKADEDEEEDKDKDKKADDGGEPEPMASDDDRRKDRKKADDDAKADARADSASARVIRNMQAQIDRLQRSIRRPHIMTDDELNALAERQQEWDRVAQMHGLRASRPLDGERIESYDRRQAKTFQKHSDKWKDADLSVVPIDLVTKIIAPEIRADAISAAYRVDPSPGGMLREVRKADRTGRIISEFVGPIDAANGALAPFRMPRMRVANGINTKPNQF